MKRALLCFLAACTFPSPMIENVDCPDKDGDGYRDAACQPNGDCNDNNKDVHPKQPAFFATADAKVGFDYDCSGQEARDVFPATPMCTTTELVGEPKGGFVGSPKCGETTGSACTKMGGPCHADTNAKLDPVKCH